MLKLALAATAALMASAQASSEIFLEKLANPNAVSNDVTVTDDTLGEATLCQYCVSGFGKILAGITLVGEKVEAEGCQELCPLVIKDNPKLEEDCVWGCELIGLAAMIAVIEESHMEPVHICTKYANQCLFKDGEATFTYADISPKKVVHDSGTSVTLTTHLEVTKDVGTGFFNVVESYEQYPSGGKFHANEFFLQARCWQLHLAIHF